jgi:serine/threonine-protein phosphatase 2B catalytic subunit
VYSSLKTGLAKYTEDVYDLIMKLFDELPICAIIDETYFAVHAGISPSCQTVEDIQKINRFE